MQEPLLLPIGNNGFFTTTSHNDDHYPCLHHPPPRPPSDDDWLAGWRACRDMSHLPLPWSSLLVPSLSPLTEQWRQGQLPWQQTRPSRRYPRPGRGGTPQTHWHGATKTKTKTKTETETETKSKTVGATSLPLHLQTATPALPLLLPLRKQRQQWRQHGVSGGSSSSRVVPAAAHYFELPRSITFVLPCSASGIKFPSLS